MLEIILRETNLKPWEFDMLSMLELDLYLDGYKLRDAVHKSGLRKVWLTIFNSNVKKENVIKADELHEFWPLYTDPEINPRIAAETKVQRENEADFLRSRYHQLINDINEADARRRTEGNTGSAGAASLTEY